MGFRATDDDDEHTPEVRDGVASEQEQEHALGITPEAFVRMARELRELGCVAVRAGGYRAAWPAPAQQLSVVPVVREKPKPERPAEPEKLLATDTPEDIARRERHAEIRRAVTGES